MYWFYNDVSAQDFDILYNIIMYVGIYIINWIQIYTEGILKRNRFF